MNLPKFGVHNPIKVLMVFIGILVLGLVAFKFLPIDMMPEIEPPVISVITAYHGAGAKDVELKVTKVLENQLSTVNNLDEISSTSKEGISLISCKFNWGANLDEASNDIRDKIDFARRGLPDDITDPMLLKFNTAMFPVIGFAVTADQSYENLVDIVEERITDALKRIPGVGATMIMGTLDRQINIYLDKGKMEAYHISPQQIEGILRAENVTTPAGGLKLGRKDYIIRVPGEFSSLDQIKDTVITSYQGRPVYLKDIAEVKDSFKEKTRQINVNNKEKALIFMIQKRSGANTVDVSKQVLEKIKEIKPNLPDDLEIINIYDSSEFIWQAINSLSSSVVWGGIFVLLVVLLFLRRLRSSLIIAISIPFSLIIAFIFLYLFGYTINMMSLSSLAIAMGMVVDNSIVILENITKYFERGVKPREGSIFGALEVGPAITASTLTTVVIFVPLIFLTGITGIIFKQLAASIIIVIVASLFVSLTLTPMLCSKILKIKKLSSADSGRLDRFYVTTEKAFEFVTFKYGQVLGWALNRKKTVVSAALIIFVGSLSLLFMVGTEFMPEEDSGDLQITYQLAEGTKVEETYRVGLKITELFHRLVPEQERVFLRCGQSEEGFSAAMGMKEGPNIGMVGTKLVKQAYRDRSTKEIGSILRKELEAMPEVTRLSLDTGNPMNKLLLGGGKPITLEVRGDDLEATYQTALRIEKIFSEVEGTGDVGISLDFGKPELEVHIDRNKAALLGLNTDLISRTLRTYYEGRKATTFRKEGDEYDIYLRLKQEDRQKLRDILEIPLPSLTGRQVRLKEVAEISEGVGPVSIERINQERVIKVEANMVSRSMGEIVEDIKAQMDEITIPPGIGLRWAGMVKEQQESFRDLILLLILGIVLVYMVMAGQFESLIDPFIIMFSVPFAFTGTILMLFLTGTTISLISFIGLIMLVGIVVNNAIVLVDYIEILRARGYWKIEAIKEAGKARLRPVLMTALTTVFGLVPLALSTGEGSEIWRPLGLSVIGGLLVSTLVTLILVPVIYSIFKRKMKKKTGGQ